MNKKRRLSRPIPSLFSLMTLGILLLVDGARSGVITGDLSVTTATVGSNTQLNFEANLATLVPPSGKVTMTFSAGVNLT